MNNLKLMLLASMMFIGSLACTQKQATDETEKEEAVEAMAEEKMAEAQEERASPMRSEDGEIMGVSVTVQYSSPAVKGRTIYGDLVPYDKVWRTGANEATTFEFGSDVLINEEELAAGKYSLFTIPTETNWTVIFNQVWKQWGTKYDASKDVLLVELPAEATEATTEDLQFTIEEEGIRFSWEKISVFIPVAPAS